MRLRYASGIPGRASRPRIRPARSWRSIRMSQLTASPRLSDHEQLERLCVSIRGKLQFMDYLVRAAVADVDRFGEEPDAGTRIFIRQLIEMHASNLSVESENMRLIGELCTTLEEVLNEGGPHPLRNGDSE